MIPNINHEIGKRPMKNELKSTLQTDFLSFARKAILDLVGTKLGDDQYLEYLATELMEFVDGKTKRLIINLPPRHLKTLLFAVCSSAWKFAHEPSAKIMIVTYSEQLAESIARGIRGILLSDWFKEVYPTRVAKDHSAVMVSRRLQAVLFTLFLSAGVLQAAALISLLLTTHMTLRMRAIRNSSNAPSNFS